MGELSGVVSGVPALSILCGIQASGKSTFCLRHLSDHAVVSKDLMGGTSKEERMMERICDLMAAGSSVAVDNTNVDRESRIRLVTAGRLMGSDDIRCYSFVPDVDACLERNERREGPKKVPVVAVLSFYRRYERPIPEEGYDSMYEVRIDGEGFRTDLVYPSSQPSGQRDSKSSR